MKDLLNRIIPGKKVAILGFGREGRSTYHYLRSCFPTQDFAIIDNNLSFESDEELVRDPGITLHVGERCMENINKYEVVIKAPGIPFHVFPQDFEMARITSQTSLFLQEYGSQVIGVTGTKGKSTTASLIHHILSGCGFHSLLLGNIGLPPFEGIPAIKSTTLIVMELSSHQLEFISRSPHIALLLNIFQEHLDHYISYEAYQEAKMNIGKYQKNEDYFIYCAENSLLDQLVRKSEPSPHTLLPYSQHKIEKNGIFRDGDSVKMRIDNKLNCIYNIHSGLNLPGEHNLLNIMAAAAACYLSDVTVEQINHGVATFKGLDHRIEFVGEYEGVIYYNDSIATIPEATIEAIKTLKLVDTLILGGYDRGIDYGILYSFLVESGVRNLIFIGEAGRRMEKELSDRIILNQDVYDAVDYTDVVTIARKVTAKGRICLLSPAAASYDMFKNFEHRGTIFKKNVRSISSSHP